MISLLNEHFLIIASLIILCFGIIYKFAIHLQFPYINTSINVLAILALTTSFGILIIDSTTVTIMYNSLFIKDYVTVFVEAITLLLAIGILIVTTTYNKKEHIPQFEYVLLLLFVIISIHLLVAVEELFAFYLILEFQSICLYVLSSLKKNKYSIEAAIKYFIIGSFASILLLIGFSFIYGISGLTNMEDLYIFLINAKQQEQLDIIITLAIAFISAGLFFKIYMAPMHLWVSDIYAQSPTSSVIIFATTSLIPFYVIMFKFYVHLFSEYDYVWKTILVITCLSSIVIGTIGAMYQYSIKRLLAYSSIANTGYIFSSLIVYSSPFLVSHGILYLLLYTINTFGIFTLVINMRFRSENQEEYQLENIYQLQGLFKQSRGISFIYMIYFYTVAGLPPFSFFFSKIYLFTSLIYNNNSFWMIVLMAILTVMSVFYYIRIIQMIFFNKQVHNHALLNIPDHIIYITGLILAINVFFIIGALNFVSVVNYITFYLYI